MKRKTERNKKSKHFWRTITQKGEYNQHTFFLWKKSADSFYFCLRGMIFPKCSVNLFSTSRTVPPSIHGHKSALFKSLPSQLGKETQSAKRRKLKINSRTRFDPKLRKIKYIPYTELPFMVYAFSFWKHSERGTKCCLKGFNRLVSLFRSSPFLTLILCEGLLEPCVVSSVLLLRPVLGTL